jgi:uncharacterized membrane protein
MADENSIDRDEALFLSIIYSFHAAAMQQMGKIANPFTGKVERDLDAARGTIDVLAMFRKKTEGNLTDRESRVVTGLITELQLNYVDESKRAPAAEEKEPAPEAEAAAEPTAEAEATAEKEEGAEEAAAAEGEERPAAKAETEPADVEKPAEEEPKKKEAGERGASKKKKKKKER